jgi:putative flippase GtrA
MRAQNPGETSQADRRGERTQSGRGDAHRVDRHDLPLRLSVGGLVSLMLSPRARPLRAVATGTLSAIVQLLILDALSDRQLSPLVADAVAIPLAAQVNFVLSSVFTWYDRPARGRTRHSILERWVAYQGSTLAAGMLNLLLFAAIHGVIFPAAAALVANAGAAAGSYLLNDHLVFRVRRGSHPAEPLMARTEDLILTRTDELAAPGKRRGSE